HDGPEGLTSLGHVGVPLGGGPHFHPARNPDDDRVLLQAGVLPQDRGQADSSLTVKLALGGAGKEKPHESPGLPLGQGQRPQLLLQLAPLVVGIEEETPVEAPGRDELRPESLPELGGDDEPAFIVHGMAVLAQKHRSRRPRSPIGPLYPTFPHDAPLSPTRSPPPLPTPHAPRPNSRPSDL